MKLKKNYLLQITFYISSIVFYIGFYMLILNFFSDIEDKTDFIKVSLVFVFMPIVFLSISSVINLLINLPLKPILILNNDTFVYDNQTFRYSDIYKLEYNLGHISKSHFEKAKLIIHRKHSQKISINNPSMKMVIMMKKKCLNKPFKIENWQETIILGVVLLVVVILIGIFGVK